jgi:hypothetical protein
MSEMIPGACPNALIAAQADATATPDWPRDQMADT